ncbi:MAG: phosphohistidine phosphatase SixA [Bryobacteraceae bacterium]|nr:phosphohistidine phosphatase SixA [Bryobacteraceae bacterium]
MEIYLLRHGIAESAKAGMSDADRALTPDGKKKMRAVLKVAAGAGVEPSKILTSPLRRAMETAQIAAEVLRYEGEVVKADVLLPGGAPQDVWDELRSLKAETSIVLSGHEPQFGYLAAYLLGAPSVQVDVKKGSLLRIDVDEFSPHPRGVLRWYLTPRLAGA